jgi:hypothetical protein
MVRWSEAEAKLHELRRAGKATAPKKPTVPESAILRAILEYVALCPTVAKAWRTNSGAMRKNYVAKDGTTREHFVRFNGERGVSDVIGFTNGGKFLAIEAKREGEKPTDDQVAFLDAVRRAGGVAVLAYSVDDVVVALSRER